MKLLKPDATVDGKIIFNFESNGEVISIIKDAADYKKATLKAVKDEAVAEAKAKVKEKEDKKNKRDTLLAALEAAGIIAEEIV